MTDERKKQMEQDAQAFIEAHAKRGEEAIIILHLTEDGWEMHKNLHRSGAIRVMLEVVSSLAEQLEDANDNEIQ